MIPHTQHINWLKSEQRRRGWSGKIGSLTHKSFCPFCYLRTHPKHNTLWPRWCLLDVRKIFTFLTPKSEKPYNWNLKLPV